MLRRDSSLGCVAPERLTRLLVQHAPGGLERSGKRAQVDQGSEAAIDQIESGPEGEPQWHKSGQHKDENQAVAQPVHQLPV